MMILGKKLGSDIQENLFANMGLSPPLEARNSFHFVTENYSSQTQPENYREHTSCHVDLNLKSRCGSESTIKRNRQWKLRNVNLVS